MELRRLENCHAVRCAELEEVLFPGEDPWSERAFYSVSVELVYRRV